MNKLSTELITIPKEWLENKMKSLMVANGAALSTEERGVSQNAHNILTELLDKSKSAEEVFIASRAMSIDYNTMELFIDKDCVKYPYYQDYLNSLI